MLIYIEFNIWDMTAVLQALGRGPRALLFSAHDLQRLVIAQIIKKSKFIH